MRIIDRYIYVEVLSYSLVGLGVFTFVFFVPHLVRLMELVVRHTAGWGTIALLVLCTLPDVLTYTVPMAVLVGVLIGLGRMSADSEIIALHAAGISLRRLLVPVGALALATALFTLTMTSAAGPAAVRTFRSVENRLRATQASFQVQPRVFDERFPRLVLYVHDASAAGTNWRGIFLAEAARGTAETGQGNLRPSVSGQAGDPSAPLGAGRENETGNSRSETWPDVSRLTLAEGAIVVADRAEGKLQLHLRNGTTHEYARREPNRYSVSTFGESDLAVPVAREDETRNSKSETRYAERSWEELLAVASPVSPAGGLTRSTGEAVKGSSAEAWREARVELHRRLAFPAACLVFALLGVPVGVRPRRGGRATGFVLTLLLIFAYYLLLVTGTGMARHGRLPPGLGIWAANLLTALAALLLLRRKESLEAGRWKFPLAAGWMAALRASGKNVVAWWRPARGQGPASPIEPFNRSTGEEVTGEQAVPAAVRRRLPGGVGGPLLLDVYVLRSFVSYLVVLLAGFVLLFEAFTFFELLDDMARNQIPFEVAAAYFYFLIPHLVYQLAPLAALVAVLVTLGLMAKNNEITALKASGISLYRLSLPLVLAGAALAAGMFALDDTYLPYANQKQDALRNQIKGRPAQTFYQPRRQWIFGENMKLYNYDFFDPFRNLFGGLSVFELDPITFQMRRRVFAARAHWEESMKTWVLEEGWVRDFPNQSPNHAITQSPNGPISYVPFTVITLAELTEPPRYFNREVRQWYQLNWRELRQYIRDLQQAGFDVGRLSVQWHRKFAFPLIALLIVVLGIPFSFLMGTRGAVSGLAAGVGLGLAYWMVAALLEAMGAVGQLPPLVAGWAPDLIFAFLAAYFFLKMPT